MNGTNPRIQAHVGVPWLRDGEQSEVKRGDAACQLPATRNGGSAGRP